MNRKERRTQIKKRRSALGRGKLLCFGCETVVRRQSKEHFWPAWLTKRAKIKTIKVPWLGNKELHPSKITIPLCQECNHAFGGELEGPVSQAFDDLESKKGITDLQAETLVRWLWKFEGLSWQIYNSDNLELHYSQKWTLKERVLGTGFDQIRPKLTLAISLIEENDAGFDEWPIGLDSPITQSNAIFVSGVFCKIAIMVVLRNFVELVPDSFDLYFFPVDKEDEGDAVFKPNVGFATCKEAIDTTVLASLELTEAHERFARNADGRYPLVLPQRSKIILPKIIS